MALDTNIALGVRPVEQPNMLAQMGQMMQLRQMQQENEGTNALREFYAQGGDINKAEDRQRLLSRAPIQGQTILGKESERRARDVVTLGKEYDNARVGLNGITDEAGYYNWVLSSFNNPYISAHQTQMGITPEKALANARATVAKEGLNTALAKSAMGIEKYIPLDLQLQNSTKNAQIAAASGNRNATVNEQRFAAEQEQRKLVRSILTGSENPSAAPVIGNVSIGGGGGGTPTETRSSIFVNPASNNVLATQVAPQITSAPNVNALNPNAPSRVDQITRQLTQLAKVGGPEANQAMEGLVKEYNVLNPAGKIDLGQDGFLRTINERSGVATFVTGADGKPVKGNVTPVIRSVLDQTDPAGKRMIDVNINEHVAGTGLGADGKGAPPKGVLGISNSQIPPNYMIDPANPQGLIPVPGSAADPNAAVPSGYRKTATGFEPIPGGPQDPNAAVPPNYRKKADGSLEFIPGSAADPKAAALLRGPRAGYKYNDAGEEVRIPQTGVPEGLRLKPGERWSEERQVVEQVPGSAAFIEQQKKHAGDLNATKTAQTSTKWGTGRIDKILDPKNKTGFENSFGGFTAYGTKQFSGNTATVQSEIDSLKSDLKNRGLQIIRSGGSIGAITEKEWPIIESMIATLSPKMDIKDARELLEEVRAKFEALENLAVEKYNDQWQGTQYHKPVSTSGGAGSSTGATANPPIYATNGKDRIMSTDGGNTWTPVKAK